MLNPWEPTNAAQKYWIAKWNNEQANCNACTKQSKCCIAERKDKNTCQNLRERN